MTSTANEDYIDMNGMKMSVQDRQALQCQVGRFRLKDMPLPIDNTEILKKSLPNFDLQKQNGREANIRDQAPMSKVKAAMDLA
jgi:hypothetical protein